MNVTRSLAKQFIQYLAPNDAFFRGIVSEGTKVFQGSPLGTLYFSENGKKEILMAYSKIDGTVIHIKKPGYVEAGSPIVRIHKIFHPFENTERCLNAFEYSPGVTTLG